MAWQGYGWGKGRGKGWGRGRGGPRWTGGGPGGFQPYQPIQPQLPPPPPNGVRAAVCVDDNNGLESHVSPVFARAPIILFIDIVNGNIANIYPVQNPYAMGGGGAGFAFAQFVAGAGARIVIASTIGPNAQAMLQQQGISVYSVPPGSRVVDALRGAGLIR
ncbi:NifB/NifX family molybdenum-iron cluster-binding protein [Staphylothermus hellenicus]|uniref:Dinitrogenase iron-molybdenum cofactor biosynthesis protein n=1 Tax=Staphylothermus hellenicus (strain DSM 12710 / JCM 10830 / BK20S6-10-b1 / P8) TaxID=591019 RepID=D7DBW3_STAHD|nr:NifB/NifX family molybdenum-iron cluster-binding protein [Staphylothermus hellenicus]ADI31660.1 Dinitrogenase iron-molybdenum cofactor biosynthesis protein [Staphylothermus hellenicus DSM 12710]